LLYGIAQHGGAHKVGTIYIFNMATAELSAQYNLDRVSSGTLEFYGLTEGKDGKLYGTGRAGLGDQVGVIFQFDPMQKTLDVMHPFTQLNDGLPNRGNLTLLSDGTLVGQTFTGGAHDHGVLFHFNPQTQACTIHHDFDAGTVNDLSEVTFVPGPTVITAIDDEAGRSGFAYPNPVADRVYLDAAPGEVRAVRVVNAVAHRTVVPFVKVDGNYEVDVERLAPGFYVLEMYTSSDVRKVKVVKK
jgi:uncharacterized repeat protein (TIGR03803 family)